MSLKQIAKSIIDKNTWFSESRFYFNFQKRRQRGNLVPEYSNCKQVELLKQLETTGCAVIPNFISADICGQILEEVEQPIKDHHAGKEIKDYFSAEGGHERMGNIDEYSPLAKEHFYNNQFVIDLAKSYVSSKAVGYRKEADYKYKVGGQYQADLAHFDDWRHRFKAFLLLHEVTEENAPLIYYANSHKGDRWRKEWEYIFHRDGVNGRYGHFFPQEFRKLKQEQNFVRTPIIGKAGTLFLGDFRGIHSGSPLLSGKRVMLNYTFGLL